MSTLFVLQKKKKPCLKVHLNVFDDETCEENIDLIDKIHYNFCLRTSVLDFKQYYPPSCFLQLKYEAIKEKKELQKFAEQ